MNDFSLVSRQIFVPNHRVVWYSTRGRDQWGQATVREVFISGMAGSSAAMVRVVFRWVV